ncbi:MAG: type VII toxin-antitoxin system HepT family RNase toxin [Candidatus Brocadia sp.]
MVDKPLIIRKLTELDEYLKQIGEFSSVTLEEYSRDWKAQRIVERTLQMMIETCADIANHIISDRGYRTPDNYGDTFRVLHENGVLRKELFEIMLKMARFRNIVVHQYDKIDEVIVIGILRNNLNDFKAYRDAILRILD